MLHYAETISWRLGIDETRTSREQAGKAAVLAGAYRILEEKRSESGGILPSQVITAQEFLVLEEAILREGIGAVAFFPLALVPTKASKAIQSQSAPLQLTLQDKRFHIEIGENFSPSVLKGLILTLEQL